MQQAEKRTKQMHEEYRSDACEVKTTCENHQRRQMREHEENVRRLTSELRHAAARRDKFTTELQQAGSSAASRGLYQELNQAEQRAHAARSQAYCAATNPHYLPNERKTDSDERLRALIQRRFQR